VTFIPTVFGSPHLVAVHSRRSRPVLQYLVGGTGDPKLVSLDAVERRLAALAHPVRLRLVRTLTRSTCENGPLAANSRASGAFLLCPGVCHLVAL
jgi:hypothetical protein